MSRHASLKVASFGIRNRSVLQRTERIDLLAREGRWKEGDRVVGLPKTKVPGKVKSK